MLCVMGVMLLSPLGHLEPGQGGSWREAGAFGWLLDGRLGDPGSW